MDASSYNRDLGNGVWNVSQVVSFRSMFENSAINRSVSAWEMDSAQELDRMFYNATSFNQNLCTWQNYIPSDASVTDMFVGTSCPDQGDPDLSLMPVNPLCYNTCDLTTMPPVIVNPSTNAPVNPPTTPPVPELPVQTSAPQTAAPASQAPVPSSQTGDENPLVQNQTTQVNTLIKIEPHSSDIVKVTVESWPLNGGLAVQNDGTVVYTPNPDFVGSDVFVIKTCNAAELCETVTIMMEVVAIDESSSNNGSALYGLLALIIIPVVALFIFYKRFGCGENKDRRDSTHLPVQQASQLATPVSVDPVGTKSRNTTDDTNTFLPDVKDQCRTVPVENQDPPVADAVLLDSFVDPFEGFAI